MANVKVLAELDKMEQLNKEYPEGYVLTVSSDTASGIEFKVPSGGGSGGGSGDIPTSGGYATVPQYLLKKVIIEDAPNVGETEGIENDNEVVYVFSFTAKEQTDLRNINFDMVTTFSGSSGCYLKDAPSYSGFTDNGDGSYEYTYTVRAATTLAAFDGNGYFRIQIMIYISTLMLD